MLSLTPHLLNLFKTHSTLEREKRYGVAVSGGPDSMALAHAMIVIGKEQGKEIYLITVDHGLRAEAKDEAAMIAKWAQDQAVDYVHHETLTWGDAKPLTAVMEWARKARYKMMAEYCYKNYVRTLFVAHHQDDQAETFLIRLSKGSGLDGLASMAALRDYNENLKIVRPFLKASKEELIEYCKDNNIPFITDPSNKNEDYMRPRLRTSMEALGEEGLTTKRLATTAKRLGRAREALESLSTKALSACEISASEKSYVLNYDILRQQPEEIGLRVIQNIISQMRPNADYQVRMEKLEELFESLWFSAEKFKPRTLGGCKFSLKHDKAADYQALYIEKEEG